MGTEPKGQDEPHGKDEPRHDEWDNFVLDENFVRGAEVSEPTARTRMLTERWRNEAPDPQPWRSDEPPAGWIHSRSSKQREKDKKPKKKRRGWFRRKGKKEEGDAE
ncbi:hypothetical protein PJ985_21390 [Streptomyces sp. ACA25]|uniref:SGM_3592 family protein n=1 Tax=Streptomyces sp. ACA25 TaxID=3022596 RepID=UPI0023076442|nr:hypothetical protein [Streptomyces sp. ACA25]MDB1090115.1 hypothetical protein [Streptomyces sp. ACA25]